MAGTVHWLLSQHDDGSVFVEFSPSATTGNHAGAGLIQTVTIDSDLVVDAGNELDLDALEMGIATGDWQRPNRGGVFLWCLFQIL